MHSINWLFTLIVGFVVRNISRGKREREHQIENGIFNKVVAAHNVSVPRKFRYIFAPVLIKFLVQTIFDPDVENRDDNDNNRAESIL